MTRQTPTKSPRRGLIEEFVLEGKLIFRLLLDSRVSILLKLIPLAGLIFVVNPVDFPGFLDDLLVFILSLILFVELSPRQVVDEHRKYLRSVVTAEWHEAPEKKIVDGEIRDVEDQAAEKEKTER